MRIGAKSWAAGRFMAATMHTANRLAIRLPPVRSAINAATAARNGAPKPAPEFGSPEDFQLAQALNRLKGKTVLVSKTAIERKAEATTN